MMEFKQLDIKQQGGWFKRTIWTQHGKKTILYIALGALIGAIFFILSEDKTMAEIATGDLVQSVFTGGLFGFLITNNPCARNKC